MQLVNNHRAALGLRTLVGSGALDASAVWKARHMAMYGYMAHSDPAPPVARSTGERMQACGVTGSWGENIAYGYATAQTVFNGWLNSPGHRANIENPNWLAMGSGAATSSSGSTYWAHTFGTSTGGLRPHRARAGTPSPCLCPCRFLFPSRSGSCSAPGPSVPIPTPTPTPAPTPGTPAAATAKPAPSASGVVLSNLRVAPRQPEAGKPLRTSVAASKRGARLRNAHVFCSGRLEGRVLEVVSRRYRNGKATCVWQLPASARGKLVSAAIVVQQGRVEVSAPFRARVSG